MITGDYLYKVTKITCSKPELHQPHKPLYNLPSGCWKIQPILPPLVQFKLTPFIQSKLIPFVHLKLRPSNR